MISEETLRSRVRTVCKEVGGLRLAARLMGVDAGYLCAFLKGRKHGGRKIADFFGLSPVVAYKGESL